MFTQGEREVFRGHLKEHVEKPGPGNYHIISEFGVYKPPSFNIKAKSSLTNY